MKRAALFAMSLILVAERPAPAQDSGFDSYWHDGKAELDGYQWTGTRYGEIRKGQCVMIFVTEPFSKSRFVKVEDPKRDPQDTFDALKLNLIRDFQTGIYDYNTMTSVFVRSAGFKPAKITFSSAEWCGHVFNELVFREDRIEERYLSYFEDESETRSITRMRSGIAEDSLYILLRGLRGEFLPAGEQRSFPFLPGTFYHRMTHRTPDWMEVRIERLAETEKLQVPAGIFETMVYVVRTDDGREGRFHIESAYPHRIVRWTWRLTRETGMIESGELAGSVRLKYWELNRNGHESYLGDLGFPGTAR